MSRKPHASPVSENRTRRLAPPSRIPALLAACLAALGLGLVSFGAAGQEPDREALHKQALKLEEDGNYQESFDIFKGLALDPETDGEMATEALSRAVNNLQRLNRLTERDAFLEEFIEVHSGKWQALYRAARIYHQGDHNGFLIAGEFERGSHRGGGQPANVADRDRLRALQLMQTALPLVRENGSGADAARFCREFAEMVLQGRFGQQEAWRLQYLTDLSELPDPEKGHARYYGGQTRGAPVDADGNPVFHHVPDSWEAAETDGERWRWLLDSAIEANPATRDDVLLEYADFLRAQFGVQTMANFGFRPTHEEGDESGTYALHTLGEDETIARLATGIKRFDLPPEFNYIKILEAIGSARAHDALTRLASVFENRRQFPRAARYWKQVLDLPHLSDHQEENAKQQLAQIVDNWGAFEPVMSQPADRGATVDYVFRNGDEVKFTAHRIDVARLLDDVRDYVESDPDRIDWPKVNLGDVGHRLVRQNEDKYLDGKVAEWTLDLDPRPDHFDRRITVDTPLEKAGAYLLVAEMDDGNTSRIVLWLQDAAIARKQLDGAILYYVADARTGKAAPLAKLDFFGYRQERKKRGVTWMNEYETIVKKFSKTSDLNGLVTVDGDEMSQNSQWLVTHGEKGDRLAFLGFDNVWFGRHYDQEYNAVKVLGITDRPVYRPDQPVQFKIWVRQAKYDQEDSSAWAGRTFTIEINNPKGDKIYEKQLETDEYAGINDELTLASDAALGVYSMTLDGPAGRQSAGTFRVEEYKKPEFEVTVEAPEKPIMLGEKVTAKVKAKYYFGEPVREAKVKIKVLRHEHSANWYPPSRWDWFYGSGYWWFGYDYAWYPGWRSWGCVRPAPFWWHRPSPAPEVVVEMEVEIDENGEAEVLIDTGPAQELHANSDHRYEITAEVTDLSRRTIVGSGKVLVARKPFQVYAWTSRGHYRVDDTIQADFAALTLDRRPVAGKGVARLLRVTYDKVGAEENPEPREAEVQRWDLDPDAEGRATLQAKASAPGQYRFSWTVTDEAGHEIEGGYVFVIRGEGFDGSEFRFNDIEIVPDKKDYQPGETVRLMVNANRPGATVLLFVRPTNGVYLPPRVLQLEGKSTVAEIEVAKKDMPNFFVEAMTIADARVHTEAREIAVPPETRVLDLEVEPSAEAYLPGEEASVQLRLRDHTGEPFVGSLVVTAYDKALEYISGGSNVPDVKEFFWKWRRRHNPQTMSNLERWTRQVLEEDETAMRPIGVFGASVADEMDATAWAEGGAMFYSLNGNMAGGRGVLRTNFKGMTAMGGRSVNARVPSSSPAPAADMAFGMEDEAAELKESAAEPNAGGGAGGAEATPMVRQAFADNAFWAAAIETDSNGEASFTMTMPDNLTAWKIKSWAMGHGTKVAEASSEVVTRKNVIVRLQAPRFFVEKDEVVISANIHNYLETDKTASAVLELEGGCLRFDDGIAVAVADDPDGQPDVLRRRQTVEVEAGGEIRVDWRVKVVREGEALIRVKALTDEESDAMEMTYPVYVHGQEKMVPSSGMIRPENSSAKVVIDVPKERRIDESRLEIRYSPTLAGAMVDALPYLAGYPYGCTEQTLNRFLPTVITQRILLEMNLDLADIREKRANLNAQELGDDAERAAQWKRFRDSHGEYLEPVFDVAKVRDMSETGVQALIDMQLSDGGWGWFSGYYERSSPHTTAVVVHGLQIARENDVAVPDDILERGVEWLRRYEEEQVRRILNYEKRKDPYKAHADDMDAFVYMVLADAGHENGRMRDFLYRDRTHLAAYGKAMVGMAFHDQNHTEERDMLIRNIEQFLVRDDENQTAYLNLRNTGYWWRWYGSEWEAHAYYLKLLAKTGRTDDWKAPYLVKYLLNNRKHATWWNSTRDTAICIEAFAEYLRATNEHKPDLTVQILVDGVKHHEVRITPETLFSFDNKFVLEGDAVESGRHEIEIRKTGSGPLYFNAYLSYFSLEDFITRAGLEVKVQRDVYRLVPADKTIKVAGSRGQVADQRVEKYERQALASGDALESGDLVEVELVIESKNDYEYLVFEDMKAAGFEPVEVRSGYTGNEMGAYVEFRDNRTAFFVRQLARGRHSVSYRLRAEIPGRFSALPAHGYAMYAPELRGNSDEIKLVIED